MITSSMQGNHEKSEDYLAKVKLLPLTCEFQESPFNIDRMRDLSNMAAGGSVALIRGKLGSLSEDLVKDRLVIRFGI